MLRNTHLNYDESLKYWTNVSPTIDGVLGGFGFVSDADIEGSKLFLQSILSRTDAPGNGYALDCGAGIGRITKFLLLPLFQSVDVVEPVEKFIDTIREFVDHSRNLGTLYKNSLQEFKPEKKYDLIWSQWVLGYLSDEDLIKFLGRCRDALADGGIIIVKENITSSGKEEKDETDSSITRPLKSFLRIFKKSNLMRIKQCKQTNFPSSLYPVYMFALIPNSEAEAIVS